MPFARLTLFPHQAPDANDRLAGDLTRLIATDLGKRPELTSVLIEARQDVYWSIGASAMDAAAHLEVCVTAGTNSEDEKQMFIANAMALLRQAFPTLAAATYIVVRELPGTDWGYDGTTQAARAKNSA